MEPRELLYTAGRAVLVYFVMLLVLRVSGKRAIGNFSAFDLLVALMLGEVVDEIIYGNVTLLQGLVPIVVVAALHYGTSWLSYARGGVAHVVEGEPTVIVRDGELDRKGMRAERMSERDVMAELRLSSVADVREVKLATVETDGQVSVIRAPWAEPLQKSDLAGAIGEDLHARPAAAEPEMLTDSPAALGRER